MTPERFNKLLKRIKNDKNALETIYDFYYPRIKLHIRRKYRNISDEDIAQEFFINLLQFDNFNHIKNPTSWIYTSCDNIAKKYFIKYELIDIDSEQICDDSLPLIEEILLNDEIRKIFEILNDETSKTIFYLYYWEGYNLREIAELLKLNKSTVKQKHTRGLKKLKDLLDDVAKKNKQAL